VVVVLLFPKVAHVLAVVDTAAGTRKRRGMGRQHLLSYST
jgi:hypothetical protein